MSPPLVCEVLIPERSSKVARRQQIEDSNRPEAWRTLERIACLLGVAKTTGIMQQRSDSPLSDEESVLLAAGYIERECGIAT